MLVVRNGGNSGFGSTQMDLHPIEFQTSAHTATPSTVLRRRLGYRFKCYSRRNEIINTADSPPVECGERESQPSLANRAPRIF